METREFQISIPDLDGTGRERKVTVEVPVRYHDAAKEWVLTKEAHDLIENTYRKEMGLLSKEQLKELRTCYGYTQEQMGKIFQVGARSWNRWETGKQRPSRAINLLIKAVYDEKLDINYLRELAGFEKDSSRWLDIRNELIDRNAAPYLMEKPGKTPVMSSPRKRPLAYQALPA